VHNRIARVAKNGDSVNASGAHTIDGRGRFIMPGMTEAHTHFSWNDHACVMRSRAWSYIWRSTKGGTRAAAKYAPLRMRHETGVALQI
jgi:predicted amidohydrolase YtcJ